jgi:hypothetical protein
MTTFTRRWADQAVARVGEYLFVQSGGLTFHVGVTRIDFRLAAVHGSRR